MSLTFTDLPPAIQADAITGFATDIWTVARHVISDTDAYPQNTHTMTALMAAIAQRTCPSAAVLRTVVAWTLFTMEWRQRRRALTPDELLIREAADRLSEALYQSRRLHREI